MRFYGYIIGAGESRLIQATGHYIRGISGDLRYQISLDDGPETGFMTGLAYAPPEPFRFVRVRNPQPVEQYIEVAIADSTISDNRLVGGSIAPKPGGSIQAVGDIAGGGTIAANQDRRQLVMRASVDNANALTIAGLPLQPGDTFELDVTGEVDVGGDPGDVLHIAEVV